MTERRISIDTLSRVEGEGALYVRLEGDQVADVQLRIIEPPRFFEAFLRGRHYTEAPDITARICGICPVAYLMSACHAMEQICGVTVDGQLRELRRLLYCGEWIASHALHVHMLHLPDFLGYSDAVAMAKDHRAVVERGLQIKKLGNKLMRILGGREIHPVNIRVGGFYRLPDPEEIAALVPELEAGLMLAEAALEDFLRLDFPECRHDYEFVALHHESEYPLNEGRLMSSSGMDVPISAYEDVLEQHHVAHSNALVSLVKGRAEAHMGPMARLALNQASLGPRATVAAARLSKDALKNPYQSITVRAVEIIYGFEEALRIAGQYSPPENAFLEMEPVAGTGYGCTEAPRGTCYHRYTIDSNGLITDVKIVAPSSVNQATIEKDLTQELPKLISLPDEDLKQRCEMAIRNYDPCISCATHFLNLTIDRKPAEL